MESVREAKSVGSKLCNCLQETENGVRRQG